ncbi:ankyrin repeat domain-containing protein [Wolbachia endosymbiont (group A) of Udea olivalis]|uniref:ankyrin repeat domain-containing protein n=1 Tax=Wolbachia endosymbiont (group A) of Udea olivalis TaxID=3066183 RepID=UPI003132C1B3
MVAKDNEQNLNRKTNPEINETLEGLPKMLEKEQFDHEYELVKEYLNSAYNRPLFFHDRSLVGAVEFKYSLDNLMYERFVETSDLTESQEELNKGLLSILTVYPPSFDEKNGYIPRLTEFLKKNEKHPDLKYVLNLKIGESGLTILHLLSSVDWVSSIYGCAMGLLLKAGADPNRKSDGGKTPLHYATGSCSITHLLRAGVDTNIRDNEGKTPLHYAADIGDSKSVDLLLENNAKPDLRDGQGKTPLEVAIDNHHYHIEKCFFTDSQKILYKELHDIIHEVLYQRERSSVNYLDYIGNFTKNLKDFLEKHKNNQDLKVVLNIRGKEGKSKVLRRARSILFDSGIGTEVENLLLKAGVADQKELDYDRKECLFRTLWSNLIPRQKIMLNEFFSEVSKAQNMDLLEKVVSKAIYSGVRFNFPKRFSQGEDMYESTYNFTDRVMERISELEKNPKVASKIVCKLVSRGAVLCNNGSIKVIEALESEFQDHKTNMKEAYAEYVNRTLEFMEIVKSAASGRVKNARMDNSTFYLEYSEDSTIDVAKITDGARSLGLTQGSIEYGRDLIKIGKSEVEIITRNGTRNYTDFADNSDIVLTFYTSQGELEVRLYPDEQNKEQIRVEIKDQGLLESLKNCEEELGRNCLLGGLSVNKAIEQRYFFRSGKLCQPSETLSVNSSLGDVSLSSPIQESIQKVRWSVT